MADQKPFGKIKRKITLRGKIKKDNGYYKMRKMVTGRSLFFLNNLHQVNSEINKFDRLKMKDDNHYDLK